MSLYRYAIRVRRLFGWADLCVLAALGALVYGLIDLGAHVTGPLRTTVEIDLRPQALPGYTLLSLFRGFAAYLLSLLFTLVYGRIAAYHRRAEKILVPVLDILQSIPVLGFLPGLVLALVAIFPHRNLGLELACILMIFTGQAWNMAFSFYHSLRSIPPDLQDAARVYRLSSWQRFLQLELPSSAVGLVWNSMMSMAGGWFFLTVCEAFTLGQKDFRLPGIGSYMSVAIACGNVPAMMYGIIAMVVMIVAVDQLFWRPIVAWSQKFKMEETEAAISPRSAVFDLLQRSRILKWVDARVWMPLVAIGQPRGIPEPETGATAGVVLSPARKLAGRVVGLALFALVGWGSWRVVQLMAGLTVGAWLSVGGGAGLTLLRVAVAVVIGSLWTIPVGVMIGMNPRLSRVMQPVIQVLASFPAPILYPLVLMGLHLAGIGINYGAVVLMLMGTQWYILFNVIAGAMAIPQDLCEVSTVYRMPRWERWRRLILPAIFPYLITGWVTAAGGAWNASIVAEFVQIPNETLTANGLGSMIMSATHRGDFAMLAASILVMCLVVVGINRLFWRRLYAVAEDKYSLSK